MHEPDDEQTDPGGTDAVPHENVVAPATGSETPAMASTAPDPEADAHAAASLTRKQAGTGAVPSGEVAADRQRTEVGEPAGPGVPTVATASSTSFVTTTTTTTRVAGEVALTETTTTTHPVTSPYAGPSGSFPRPVG